MKIDPFAHGMAKAQARNMTQNACDAAEEATRAWNEVSRLKSEAMDDMYEYNALKAHYVAKEAENEYLLGLLDEAHGGPENNPARKKVYSEDTKLRIPSGPRSGELPEARDHIFYTAMKKRFDESPSLPERFKNWFDVIRHKRIFG